MQNSNEKPRTSSETRFRDSAQLFRISHQKSMRIQQLNNLLTGQRDDTIVPRPGEFLVVQSQPTSQNHGVTRDDIDKVMRKSQSSLGLVNTGFQQTQQSFKNQVLNSDKTVTKELAVRDSLTLEQKQSQLIENEFLRTSLTNNLRQITQSRQEVQLLTQSTKLLNVGVRNQHSTISMTERHQQSSSLQQNEIKRLKPSASVVLLPRLKQELTQRSSSTILLTEGDQKLQVNVQAKFDLKNARKDNKSGLSHSYRASQNQNSYKQYFKQPQVVIPEIVSYQRQLNKENSKISPFMVSEDRLLTPSPSLPLLSKPSSQFLRKMSQNQQKHEQSTQKQYLNIEVYDPYFGEEDFTTLIDKYRDHATGKTMAYSKWSIDNRSYADRECEVISFDPADEHFVIQWVVNNRKKRVSRFNLRFKLEDEARWTNRLEQANRLRSEGQMIMQYLMLKSETDLAKKQSNNQKQQLPVLADDTKTKISYLILSFNSYLNSLKSRPVKQQLVTFNRSAADRYNIKFSNIWQEFNSKSIKEVVNMISRDMQSKQLDLSILSNLFQEIDQEFISVHKKIQFDYQLPYNIDKFQYMAAVIPSQMFVPLQDKILSEKDIIVIPKRHADFSSVLKKMQSKLIIAQPQKLKILQQSLVHLCQVSLKDFVCLKFTAPLKLDEFIEAHATEGRQIIKLFNNHLFDIEYEIQKLINAAISSNIRLNQQLLSEITYNKHEFKAVGLDPSLQSEISQLQKVVQMRQEQSTKTIFIASTNRLINYLQKIITVVRQSCNKDLHYERLNIDDFKVISRDAILETRMTRNYYFKIQAKLRVTEKSIVIDPPINEWTSKLINYIQGFLEQLQSLPCFHVDPTITKPVNEDKRTHVFSQEELIPQEVLSNIRILFDTLMIIPQDILVVCQQFESLLQTDIQEFKKVHKKANLPVELYRDLLDQGIELNKVAEEVFFEPVLKLGPFQIDCSSVRSRIDKKTKEIQQVLFDCIKTKITQTNKQIEQEVEDVLKIIKLQTTFVDVEHVTETKLYLANLPNKMLEIRQLIKDAMSKMTLLEKYQCQLGQQEMATTWLSLSKPLQIFEAQGNCAELLEQYSDKFYIELKETQLVLIEDIIEIQKELDIIIRFESLQMYEKAVNKCDVLLDRIEQVISTSAIVNRREGLYNQIKTDYSKLTEIRKKFMPFNLLWNFARDYFYKYNMWMNGPIADLDREKMPNEINMACRQLLKLEKTDLRVTAGMSIIIVNELREKFQQLKPYLPLIVALKNPDLQPRHWDIINKINDDIKISNDLSQTVNELDKLKVMGVLEDIASVSDIATKEKQLEIQLNKMRHEWSTVKFQLQEYEGTTIILGLQPIWDMLDEQIQKTMIIAGSPYVKYLIQEVVYWKQTLVKMQEVLEEWSLAQRGWLYLYPILNSSDIQKQLEDVSATFNSVDKMWRVIMLQTQNQPQVIEACNQLKVYENLVQCNVTMDKVQKSLNNYLHEKRLLFPRFFFLSNDDLLHILSQRKEPLRVQDHLNKCFEGIQKLTFTDKQEQLMALGMNSAIGEYVQFIDPVNTFTNNQGVSEVRPVVDWLQDVEVNMKHCLKQEVIKAQADFANIPKETWVSKYPQQIVLVIDQLQWTAKVEAAIKRTSLVALKQAFVEEEQKLQQLVQIIQKSQASPATMMTLNSLIVLDVHTKDVTQQLLGKHQIKVSDFDWQSQMRHYQQSTDILLSMMDSTRYYGFEYLGNQSRLVITPLTDRCYRTLMGALKLNLGGAPEGPAGTGKTETTKDLAKAIAKQCLVFNCSDQLDVLTMAKFFKGLACCGAWACFDEFNRIELEVLSVIAAQILTIQTALMRKRPNELFTFEDESILMNASCAVFITMNPGYAGRSELPDNLKALFRPVAMMVPNYAMIAEISLYSYGFLNARELSIKITFSLKLCSEQLSTQSHYDYSMRVVKSIILAAGVYKQDHPSADEYHLVLKAICDCNLPKFIEPDEKLFNGIINDLFPQTEQATSNNMQLLNALDDAMVERNLTRVPAFTIKAIQLFDTIRVRHGLMLVGEAMAGKSEITDTLANALTRIHDPVEIFKINPKSVTIGKLYGDYEKLTRDWQDGILAKTVRKASESRNKSWVMLDGPVDAVWIENLNTVLDDNKKLCLISGEIIKLTPQTTMMFEVEDLKEASPATVSRCGMVYLSTEQLGWQCLTNSWIQQLPQALRKDQIHNYYMDLTNYFVPLIVGFLYGFDKSLDEEIRISSLKPMIPLSTNQLVKQFLNLFKSLLMQSIEPEPIERKNSLLNDNDKQQTPSKFQQTLPYYDVVEPKLLNHILQLCLMGLAWGFGAALPTQARVSLSQFIVKSCNEMKSSTLNVKKRLDLNQLPPRDDSIYNYSYCKINQNWKWCKWEQFVDSYDLRGNLISDVKQSISEVIDPDDFDISRVQEHTYDSTELEFHNIFVITTETLKQKFYLETLVKGSNPVLLLGDTGTGKTSVMKKLINNLVKATGWETGETVLSATTTAQQVQKYFETCIEKHKKGVYGPKNPQNQLLIFVDDLNMPAKEKYGAQPPLEIIRQWIDTQGCFNKANEWYNIVSAIFASSMQLPGGGRSLPSNRLIRHFNVLFIPIFERETLHRIFTSILEWGFENHSDEWKHQIFKIANETINLFQRTVKTLLPLPGKSHYKFNLRQISEMIQGTLLVPVDVINKSNNQLDLLSKLWVHEALRVFSDRLVHQQDRDIFITQCLQPALFKQDDKLIFCNFVDTQSNVYQQVTDMPLIKQQLQKILDAYNEGKLASQKINIFLFDYVIEHLSRISRIINKRTSGHGVLVGLGDNGRKTIIKLAAFINDFSQFSIEPYKQYGVAEWQEDLKTLYKAMGIDNRSQIFILKDTDFRLDIQIEDVNNILNIGEIIGLFNEEDTEEINYELEKQLRSMRVAGKPIDVFMQRCKLNLHIMMVMSPAGNQLQNLFKKYPSFVNCTSIDWFLNWPNEALLAVSRSNLMEYSQMIQSVDSSNVDRQVSPGNVKKTQFLEQINEGSQLEEELDAQSYKDIKDHKNQNFSNVSTPLSSRKSDEVSVKSPDDFEISADVGAMDILEKVAQVFVHMHQAIAKQAETYFNERKRRVYVTPSSFMRLFSKFTSLLNQKSDFYENEIMKFNQGIANLEMAKVTIDDMQERLEALKPVLDSKSRQVENMMISLGLESREVMKVKALVDAEAELVEQQKQSAEAIKNQCSERLAEAQPHFDRAMKALKTLTTNDFVILKSFQKPPDGVKLALEACCIMLGIGPDFVKVDNSHKVADYWEKSKKLIKDYKKLISRLENYKKDDISPQTIQKILGYINNPQFNPELIKNASNAAEGICKWVIAIYHYDIVYKEIQPRREALAEAEQLLNVVKEKLRLKQEELASIVAKNESLMMEYQRQLSEKQDLLNQRDESQKKLNRASILMQSIGSEKDRWIATSQKLSKDKLTLIGDCMLTTGFLTYLGMFEGSYRQQIYQQKWCSILDMFGLSHTVQPSIRAMLANDEMVQSWLLKGLPGDSVSIENMIILEQSTLCPVFIDPQQQAYRYFKKVLLEQDDDLLIIKINQTDAVQKLEFAIVNGLPIILLNCSDVNQNTLVSVVKRDMVVINGVKYLKFNDDQIQADINFSPYIFTQFTNPQLSPEVQQASNVLNFCVTSEGLEQQLLRIICQHEQAKEEIERVKLARQNMEFNKQRKQYMEQILDILRNSGTEILESDSFVNTMEESRKITNDIISKLAAAKHIEDRLEENRKILKPLAQQGAKLYFATQSLGLLDPMYQYSMAWFNSLFEQILIENQTAKVDEEVKKDQPAGLKSRAFKPVVNTAKEVKQHRVLFLKKKFRELLYQRVQLGLFQQHKLLFAFYIAIKLNEPSQISESDFSAKLKALDLLMGKQKLSQNRTSQRHGSVIQSINTGQVSQNVLQRQFSVIGHSKAEGSRVSYSRDSQSISANEHLGLQQQVTIQQFQKEEERVKIDPVMLKFVLTNLMDKEMQPYSDLENPNPAVYSAEMWNQLHQLTAFDQFEQIQEDICKNSEPWERFMKMQNLELLPEPYYSTLPHFAFIPLIRALKPELTTLSIKRYVKRALGQFFVSPLITYLSEIFELSDSQTPILVVLTPGNDPMEAIKKLGEEKQKLPCPISLGKGQAEKARYYINEMRKSGGWIVLQNCHLGSSFLPELEQIIEQLSVAENDDSLDFKKGKEPTHPDFRMWLTSASIDYFPLTILQKSVKITSEPPKGIKTSLIRTFSQIVQNKKNLEFYDSCKKYDVWQPLFLSLSYFHAVVRERRRYGQLGWNQPSYDFNESDFRISQRQLYNMVTENEEVPFEALIYLCGECNYGGRVTDDRDRLTLTTLLYDFCNPNVLSSSNYTFVQRSELKPYAVVKFEKAKDYLEYCNKLPDADEESPYLVGLHQNASIIQSKTEAANIFANILNLNRNEEAPGKNTQIHNLLNQIQNFVREPFKLKEVQRKYPFSYEDSMNAVLLQELERYNSILAIITQSLDGLQLALQGLTQTTAEVEALSLCITNNQLPQSWLSKSYPSRKALLPYMQDLNDRLDMFQSWIDHGQPKVFWLSGFYFTHSFLAGVKQNFARAQRYPYDRVDFEFVVQKYKEESSLYKTGASQGCLISGLFLEGAGWDDAKSCICESQLKVIYVKMPLINLVAVLDKKPQVKQVYECPTYVTSQRAGTLSSTGHSTNFIMTVELACAVRGDDLEELNKNHWVKRSVALLSQLDS